MNWSNTGVAITIAFAWEINWSWAMTVVAIVRILAARRFIRVLEAFMVFRGVERLLFCFPPSKPF
jgi:Mn2+/Fe2+ NRAMP family transporter